MVWAPSLPDRRSDVLKRLVSRSKTNRGLLHPRLVADRRQKSFVSLLNQVLSWSLVDSTRQSNFSVVKFLDSMNQHWSVMFLEHVVPHVNGQVRPKPDDVLIERRVMELA